MKSVDPQAHNMAADVRPANSLAELGSAMSTWCSDDGPPTPQLDLREFCIFEEGWLSELQKSSPRPAVGQGERPEAEGARALTVVVVQRASGAENKQDAPSYGLRDKTETAAAGFDVINRMRL